MGCAFVFTITLYLTRRWHYAAENTINFKYTLKTKHYVTLHQDAERQ
jgi:hypothetical protein